MFGLFVSTLVPSSNEKVVLFPPGAPQRVSGKVSGIVNVGSTPVELNSIDLHAYIVVGDGRAYTAISEVRNHGF